MTVKLSGMQELEARLRKMPKKAKSILRSSTNDLAGSMRKDARSFAPKDSGTLRRAIKTKSRRGTRDEIRVSLLVEHGNEAKNDAWYWHFIEFGTQNSPIQKQRPFLRPAFRRAKREIEGGSFQRNVWNRIARVTLK